MPEDPVLNQGVGGSTSRGLADSAGKVWFPSVVSYAETISPNANVLRPVSQAYPLPTRSVPNTPDTATYVQIVNGTIFLGDGSITDAVCLQPDHTKHHVTAHQDAPWTVQFASGVEVDLASGAEVTAIQAAPWAVTQSGSWNVGVTGVVTVAGTVGISGTTTVAGTVASTQSGAWNVGTVASITNAVAVSGIANALPAGSNTLGKVATAADSNSLFLGTTPVTPKPAVFNASASGDTLVVAAVTGKKIRVLRFRLSGNGVVNAKFRSGTTDVSGLMFLPAPGATSGGAYCPVGVFETAAGQPLNINLSAAVAVSGELMYIEV